MDDEDEQKRETRFYLFRNAAERLDIDRDDVVKRLIASDPSFLEVRSGLGETAMHFLAVENEQEAVAFLIEQGANVNTRNDFGDTPLMDAASLNYTDLCRYLIEQGADPTVVNENDETALMKAAQSSTTQEGDLNTFLLLLEQVGDRDINNFIEAYDAEKIVLGTHWGVPPAVAALLIERGLTNGFTRPDNEDEEKGDAAWPVMSEDARAWLQANPSAIEAEPDRAG